MRMHVRLHLTRHVLDAWHGLITVCCLVMHCGSEQQYQQQQHLRKRSCGEAAEFDQSEPAGDFATVVGAGVAAVCHGNMGEGAASCRDVRITGAVQKWGRTAEASTCCTGERSRTRN